MNAVQNRLIAGAVTALLVPWIEAKTGNKLSPDEVAGLVALGAVVYHALATVGAWAASIVNRIVDKYLPPSVPPTKPAEPAKV